jgi:tRNA uridine 5-carboxymethylaminomethyl modification enzyme
MVRSIVGLERAVIVQSGYAVEYDYVPPQQTRPTLESKRIGGLFLAGQTNGTSGYEEAAGQGIIAGINAARHALEAEPLVLGRDESYIGVMIDDLVTRGTVEPYRMFTSRAEYRLLLRSDNADARLTPIGRRLGLVDEARWRRFSRKQAAAKAFADWAGRRRHQGRPVADLLRRPEGDACADIDWHAWKEALPASLTGCGDGLLDEAMAAVVTTARYDGYIRRQQREVERFRRFESRRIPDDFDFTALGQLRREARDKFSSVGPRSVGQARRIDGISPADIAVVLLHLEARRRGNAGGPG